VPTWIDFKELRRQLRFEDILSHYAIETKRRGERVTALCPLPGHAVRTDGTPRTSSLSINLARNIFQCFGCKASGNALEFACRMEGFDPSNIQQLRTAAVKVAEVFGIDTGRRRQEGTTLRQKKGNDPKPGVSEKSASGPSPVTNAPLNFELKDLDPNHPYLAERRFEPATVAYFGLGYCNRGLMRGRIAIPLHNPAGQLVGYGGRITKDSIIDDENPKYRLPGDRERDGVRFEFRKSLLLYNAHRIRNPVSDLAVVEGFPSTWWLHQCKHPNVVALMGSDCSDEQAKLIVKLVKPDGRVWLMPDGNEAGEHCARSLLERVSPDRFVRWVRLAKDEQPTDLPSHELHRLLNVSQAR
jgi:DNA primase